MKYTIDQKILDNLPFIQINSLSLEENAFVNNWIKYLLYYAKNYNNSNEVGVILDITNWENTDIVLGYEHHVKFNTDKMIKWLDEGNDNLIIIHNHPSNNIFSEKDLLNFCMTQSINTMIVAGNKGTIYFVQKLNGFNKFKVIMNYFTAKKLNNKNIPANKFMESILSSNQAALKIKFKKEEIKC